MGIRVESRVNYQQFCFLVLDEIGQPCPLREISKGKALETRLEIDAVSETFTRRRDSPEKGGGGGSRDMLIKLCN